MKNSIIVTIILVIVVGAGAFFAGMKYQQSQQPSFTAGQFGGTGGQRFGSGNGTGNRNGARPVTGDIISQDDKSITVKLADGSSKIVLISASTSINKTAAATKSDLTTGERVTAFGTTNSDGSVTAQNIQLNPGVRGMNGQGGSNPMGASSNTSSNSAGY